MRYKTIVRRMRLSPLTPHYIRKLFLAMKGISDSSTLHGGRNLGVWASAIKKVFHEADSLFRR